MASEATYRAWRLEQMKADLWPYEPLGKDDAGRGEVAFHCIRYLGQAWDQLQSLTTGEGGNLESAGLALEAAIETLERARDRLSRLEEDAPAIAVAV